MEDYYHKAFYVFAEGPTPEIAWHNVLRGEALSTIDQECVPQFIACVFSPHSRGTLDTIWDPAKKATYLKQAMYWNFRPHLLFYADCGVTPQNNHVYLLATLFPMPNDSIVFSD